MLKLKNNRGSMTIEATIIVSAVILVVAGIIFASMLLYQKIILTKTAAAAAQQGTEIWVDRHREIYSGLWEQKDGNRNISLKDLYYHLFDFSREYREQLDVLNTAESKQTEAEGVQNEKLAKIREMICKELQKGLLKPRTTTMEISYTNYLIERKIKVILRQEIKVPMMGLVRLFGGKDTLTMEGRGTAIVAEPAEYIRNIDLGLEYVNRAKDTFGLEKIATELKDRIFGGK